MELRTIDDAQRMRDFSANFFFWQGLRWVPFGLALILWAAALSGWWPFPEVVRDFAPFLAMIGALVITGWIGAYYNRVYGRTETLPKLFARRGRLKWFLVYPLIISALLVDGLARPPVLVSGFALAVAIVAYVRSTGGGRTHYWVAALALTAMSLATGLGFLPAGIDGITLLMAMLGVIYVIGGVLDHLEMRKQFATMQAAHD